jgi:8-oxo-dGTP pyrophosphatase MutT (NUDIX family)
MNRRHSTSYGIIPCIQELEGWKVFLVQHRKSAFWGFPKGHQEPGEAPLDTAKRELFEETGLKVKTVLYSEPLFEEYTYEEEKGLVEKKVYFYLAITSKDVQLDPKEILNGKWLLLKEAKETISYQEGQKLVSQIEKLLSV